MAEGPWHREWITNMFKFRYNLLLLILCFVTPVLHADEQNSTYTRDFWSPRFHTERLSYCSFGGKTCGKAVATQYCHQMGFESLTHEEIEHNVGLTHYLDNNSGCRGWKCDGFKLIQCANKIIHKPIQPYYYRLKKFVFPRFDHHRVDWCMEKNKHCGKPAAYSFCRRLGYEQVKSFKKDKGVAATRTLGSQDLCFGLECHGFSEITCYR